MSASLLALLLARPALAARTIYQQWRSTGIGSSISRPGLAFRPPPPPAACRQYRMTPRCEAPRSPVPIPHDRLEFSYSRSSGPGGQNVNKVGCVDDVRCAHRSSIGA